MEQNETKPPMTTDTTARPRNGNVAAKFFNGKRVRTEDVDDEIERGSDEKFRLTFGGKKLLNMNFDVPTLFTKDGSREKRWALVVVDVQNDFIDGSMALHEFQSIPNQELYAGVVVPIINRLLEYVRFDLIAFTRDWHPPNHCSFLGSAVNGRSATNNLHTGCNGTTNNSLNNTPNNSKLHQWPAHCVQNTIGAQFPGDLNLKPLNQGKVIIINKGTNRDVEELSAYNGLVDSGDSSNCRLHEMLDQIDDVFVVGLAWDYCVLETCRDIALKWRDARSSNNSVERSVWCLVDGCVGTRRFDAFPFIEIGCHLVSTQSLIFHVARSPKKTKSIYNSYD